MDKIDGGQMTTNKIYCDEKGTRAFILCNIGRDSKAWTCVMQKKAWKKMRRIKSPDLPRRDTADEAQNDLDAYAKQKGWEPL